MNTNPNAIRVLCYGDSNTYGVNPETFKRYPVNVRWTGLLQNLLGNNYEIIEEGLGGRFAMLNDLNNLEKNGKTYLAPCIKSHSPFDIVIINLGTNDFKDKSLTAKDVASRCEELVKIVQENAYNGEDGVPKIILICPSEVNDTIECAIEWRLGNSTKKIKQLPKELQLVAGKYGAEFVNLQELVEPSLKDGVHLDPESHRIIAEEIFNKITNLK
ncbi:GDSL-type esterase/lipase family protein [Patescibacteria group bacterium]